MNIKMDKEIDYRGHKFLMTIEELTGQGGVVYSITTSHLGARNWQIKSSVLEKHGVSIIEEEVKKHTESLQGFVDKDKSPIRILLESLGFK